MYGKKENKQLRQLKVENLKVVANEMCRRDRNNIWHTWIYQLSTINMAEKIGASLLVQLFKKNALLGIDKFSKGLLTSDQ